MTLRNALWFGGLWLASVVGLGLVAGGLKLVMKAVGAV